MRCNQRHKLSRQAALMKVTASAELRQRQKPRFSSSTASLLNEADLAPCGRDSASPLGLRGQKKYYPCPESGQLISRSLGVRSTNADVTSGPAWAEEEEHGKPQASV